MVVHIYLFRVLGNDDHKINPYKVMLLGTSAVVESSMVCACWNKTVNIDATQTWAVLMTLPAKNYALGGRYQSRFRGKDQEVLHLACHIGSGLAEGTMEI